MPPLTCGDPHAGEASNGPSDTLQVHALQARDLGVFWSSPFTPTRSRSTLRSVEVSLTCSVVPIRRYLHGQPERLVERSPVGLVDAFRGAREGRAAP